MSLIPPYIYIYIYIYIYTHTHTYIHIYICIYIYIYIYIFTKAFDSIHRGKMGQILLAYGLPKETVAAIMILYIKVKVCSPDRDTDYFDIVAGVLQGDTLAPHLFIICLDYVLRKSINKIKENSFKRTKERSRRYPQKQLPTSTTSMT